jgi:uncharacterized membrane protein YhaH (DUF805 family)
VPLWPAAPVPGDPGSLDPPWYGIGLFQAYKRMFQKYARFDGRASRAEFWWAYLANSLICLAMMAVILIAGGTWVNGYYTGTYWLINGFGAGLLILYVLYLLALIVPSLALTWRRLHDTGRSGAYFFVSFIPLVGELIALVLLAAAPDPSGVQFDRPRQVAR